MEKIKKGYLLGLFCIALGAYNLNMLFVNTGIIIAWYCVCFVFSLALAAISFYHAERWKKQEQRED